MIFIFIFKYRKQAWLSGFLLYNFIGKFAVIHVIFKNVCCMVLRYHMLLTFGTNNHLFSNCQIFALVIDVFRVLEFTESSFLFFFFFFFQKKKSSPGLQSHKRLGWKNAVLDLSLILFIKSELHCRHFAPLCNSEIFLLYFTSWNQLHQNSDSESTSKSLSFNKDSLCFIYFSVTSKSIYLRRDSLEPFKNDVTRVGGRGYQKLVTKNDIGGGGVLQIVTTSTKKNYV